MRISVIAVGRAGKSAPESLLTADYLKRAGAQGEQVGIGPVDLTEVEDRQRRNKRGGEDTARVAREGELILSSVPQGVTLVALDAGGKNYSSDEFAGWLADQRDCGVRGVALAIGGANGLSDTVLRRADMRLSLGAMIWPHLLVRVMLAEQIYRSVTILTNHPYHRA